MPEETSQQSERDCIKGEARVEIDNSGNPLFTLTFPDDAATRIAIDALVRKFHADCDSGRFLTISENVTHPLEIYVSE